MTTVKATVHNGRIELDEPLNLPDGTVLHIALPYGEVVEDGNDDDGPMSQEEIERVLTAMDAIIPFDRTPEEEERLEADRLARKEWEKAHFFERADKLAGMWK